MSNYSTSSHTLAFENGFTELAVYNVAASPSFKAATFYLENAYSLEVDGGNYVIDTTTITTEFPREFGATGDALTVNAAASDIIGVTDLRTGKYNQHTYNLSCPVKLKYEGNRLKVCSPCTGTCTAPSEDCCTTQEVIIP